MKKLLGIVYVWVGLQSIALGQTFGNEWINYSQKYYRFEILQEGLYKIDYQTLVDNGIDPSQFNSDNIQIFGRQQEQALHVYDGGDNKLDPGDFFIFYALPNDGWLDSTLFDDPNTIGNPKVSLFNDTINYFFTWNSSSNNLRYKIENADDFNPIGFPPLKFGMSKLEYTVVNPVYFQAKEPNGTSSPFFKPGEGFTSGNLNALNEPLGNIIKPFFRTYHLYTDLGAPFAEFHCKSSSNSDADSSNGEYPLYNHHLRITLADYTVVDTLFSGYQQIILNKKIEPNNLVDAYTPGLFEVVNDLDLKADQQVMSYMSLTYPRKPILYNTKKDKFTFENDVLRGSVRIEMSNANINIPDPIVLVHGSQPKKLLVNNENDTIRAFVSNSSNGVDQEFIVIDSSQLIAISTLKAINGNGNFTDYDAMDFNAADIIVYHDQMASASLSYADYRASGPGGSYNVVRANIDELYMQFGGGIPKHNAAIRRFCHFAYNNSVSKPLALTLLGKGFGIDKTRFSKDFYNSSLIPPFGYPSSDVAHTAMLESSGFAPLIPTGRVAAESEKELLDYLEKLKEFEALQDTNDVYDTPSKDWQKQVLHFSGGDTDELINQIRAYMNVYERSIEDSVFGGNVTTFVKSTSNPYDPTMVKTINERLQQGASLLNFFGHSTASGFDISVDDPGNWENKGKYPVILGNGCHAGNMYSSHEKSFSERVVLLPEEGAIAMLASTNTEFANVLYIYNLELYKQISYKSYGQPFAKQIQKTIALLQDSLPLGIGTVIQTTYASVNLHGDPLVKINSHQRPEIELRDENVYFEPANIDLSVDTIDLNIILKNLGQSVMDSFEVEIIRNFPGTNVDSIYRFTINRLHYSDTVTLRMPLQAGISVGINEFTINVDLPSYIEEQYDETMNNQLKKTLFLKLDAIVPVYPYEFAVVPEDKITIKGSTLNPIKEEKTYHFELDVTDEFNSDFLRHYSTTDVGGVKEVPFDQWLDKDNNPAPLIMTDSTVYFWRVATDSNVLIWSETSFQYIKGKEGWGQDHFYQYKNNRFSSIDYKKSEFKKDFAPITKTIQGFATHNIAYSPSNYHYDIEKLQVDYGQCGGKKLLCVAVIDSVSLEPWFTRYQGENPDNNFGNMNDDGGCAGRPMGYFAYIQDDPQSMANFNNFVNNEIPDGNYVMIWTTVNGFFSLWDPSVFTTFNNLGVNSFSGTSVERSFIIFTKKGHPETTLEELVPLDEVGTTNYKFNLLTEMHSTDYLGTEEAPLIGPAQEWKTVYWKQSPTELTPGDSTRLQIQAHNIDGEIIMTIDTLFTRNDSIIDLNQLVNASTYPYISLKATFEDRSNFTPADLQRWHVLFQPVPEAAIDGTNGYVFIPEKDTLKEGEFFQFAADIRNISDYPMDSILVNYWVEDENRIRHYLPPKRLDSLRVGQTIRDTVSISTLGYGGINSFWMEINPYKEGSSGEKDQPEQFHFNNLLQIPFYVDRDDVNPILDVTFNGRHILNGDIVDPHSEIYISLKDDNPYLIMDDISDTSLFGIFLTHPGGSQQRIPFIDGEGNSVLQWVPAESEHKRFKIVYPAYFPTDGRYELLVQGSDRSGNLSGDLDYRISFEVEHQSSITALTNYPNPFSTSTKFVFTLTGSEVPDDLLIQIMTITGKVVREITLDELGPIHIGRNITEFSWNGTDQFGDRLANGVYLYRVQSRLNGESIKHRDSDIDQYFKKGFGKMYLMR
ncbi:MAG: hypothetical protein EP338_07650 [Bacteroidetes bacterium]|nr:MAG: hypothetical protein EP338_07650 [Bacteroidota bacterium]